jgi:hypothetical protein
MESNDKSARSQWVWICIGIGFGIVCLIALIAPIVLPYFATKPKSREELTHYLPTPSPTPQATGTPSPAATPGMKKH